MQLNTAKLNLGYCYVRLKQRIFLIYNKQFVHYAWNVFDISTVDRCFILGIAQKLHRLLE